MEESALKEKIFKTLEEKFGHKQFKSKLQENAVLAAVQGIIKNWRFINEKVLGFKINHFCLNIIRKE